MLSFKSAGESHGPAVVAILEGMPAGLRLDLAAIDRELKRRQSGFGRGGRMKIEEDRVQVRGGLVHGLTNGGPLLLEVTNRDATLEEKPPVTRPRPGHADLAGAMKFLLDDARPVLERASARETCVRVAAGAVARQLLAEFGIELAACVDGIGGVEVTVDRAADLAELIRQRDASDLRCPDATASERMREVIRAAATAGDTLGGTFLVLADGIPPGLGSYAQWDQRLDGRLAQVVMAIPAIKAVEIGLGFGAARLPGSQVHDPIAWGKSAGRFGAVVRRSNHSGGLEGGVTHGGRLVVRAAMKPISTLRKPLPSIDLRTKTAAEAAFERSDVCAVPAASVIGEAVVALELARAFREKFGGDSLTEVRANFDSYVAALRQRFGGPPGGG